MRVRPRQLINRQEQDSFVLIKCFENILTYLEQSEKLSYVILSACLFDIVAGDLVVDPQQDNRMVCCEVQAEEVDGCLLLLLLSVVFYFILVTKISLR